MKTVLQPAFSIHSGRMFAYVTFLAWHRITKTFTSSNTELDIINVSNRLASVHDTNLGHIAFWTWGLLLVFKNWAIEMNGKLFQCSAARAMIPALWRLSVDKSYQIAGLEDNISQWQRLFTNKFKCALYQLQLIYIYMSVLCACYRNIQ